MDTIAGSVTTRTDVPQPSLQERIETLTDVHQRLQSLRRVPTLLLRPPSGARLGDFPPSFDPTMDREFGVTFNSTPGPDFGALNVFVEVLCSDKVQEALHAARASEEGDTSEVGVCIRGQGRKRKGRSPVGSPQPYVPSPPRTWSLFGGGEEDPPPMRAGSLVEFVRGFNRGHGEEGSGRCRLAIWSRTRLERTERTSPVVLRFVIPDVLTAYVSLVFATPESALTVESVAAFGPRERKLAHEQSDYVAFQGLSQHLARMILSHPRVGVEILMTVLVSYRGLFVERCTGCERVLSAEGHVPPVARIWEGGNGEGGRWEARHATCV